MKIDVNDADCTLLLAALGHYRPIDVQSAEGLQVLRRLDDLSSRVRRAQQEGLVDWSDEAAKREAKRAGVRDLAPGVTVIVSDERIQPAYCRGLKGVVKSFPTNTVHQRTRVLIDREQPGYDPRLDRYTKADGTISFPGNALTIVEV